MKVLLARKISMSERFSPTGRRVPVTILEATPNKITQVKTKTRDGYEAVQIGRGTRRHITRAQAGHLKDLGNIPTLREVRMPTEGIERGTELTVAQFATGERVQIVGTSKGKGFQGVVKRHGFHGAPKTHGTKDQLRMPGSIASKRQGAVEKGKRMAGRMGNERITVKGLEVIEVLPELNQLVIKGAIPGGRGTLVMVREYHNFWDSKKSL